MSCSLKAVAQDILLSGEAYRNFVSSTRSVATKNSYTKAFRLYMKFKRLTDCEQAQRWAQTYSIQHYRVADSP